VFVLLVNYVRPLDEVDRVREGHGAYLRRNYDAGRFIVSGRREPRTGGVIIARGTDRKEIDAVIAEDPFLVEGVATYDVIEFHPTAMAEGFERFADG
jgi:uncharacterized protein YciI